MRYGYLILCLLCSGISVVAQNPLKILPFDSARLIITTEYSTAEEKFYAYRSLDQYYYSNGLFDSSDMVEKEMFSIAAKLNRDSLWTDAYLSRGNRHAFKTDYNPGLSSYLKALEYKPSGWRKSANLNLIAYIYALTGNNTLALYYLRQSDSAGSFTVQNFQRNTFYGAAYNNIAKPDSALFYLQKADAAKPAAPSPSLYSVFLRQFARAYELREEDSLAELYYKKTLDYCKKENLTAGHLRLVVYYCNFLLKQTRYADAFALAAEGFSIARLKGFTEFAASTAEILKKLYSRRNMNDSAFYYSEMQITYTDSLNNQKRVSEFQNMVFSQQLKEIEEKARSAKAAEQRRENLQYAIIAMGIVFFILIYLLLIRSIIIPALVIRFLGIIALLIVFEFLNLLLHPFLEKITHHNPALMLLALVCLAAILIPLHHKSEKWALHRLVEKNKHIRQSTNKKKN